jgi:hypothetical protein
VLRTTRFIPALGLWAVLLAGTGLGAVADAPAGSSAPTTEPAGTHEVAAAQEAAGGQERISMFAVQQAVRAAYCPPPGSEIDEVQGGSTTESVLRISSERYGRGDLSLPALTMVRVWVVNDDAVEHEAGVYHPSRPGCALARVEVPGRSKAALEVRLGAGTYVVGDRSHRGEGRVLHVD